MAKTMDPFKLEVFKNAVCSLADEMSITILRTTYSSVLKGGMDFSTALCDARGRLVAQGLTLPALLGSIPSALLGSIPSALESVIRHFGNEIRPGDLYVLNDPFDGGTHLPDIFVFKPIFFQDEHLAFAATVCHHTDIGGRVAGSNAADSTECYQEGLRIPVLRLYDRGERNETLFKMIEANVRVPVLVMGDIRAQLSACHVGERVFLDLVKQFGVASCKTYLEEILVYSERLTRAAISALPDGVFAFEDWLDDDGIDHGVPIYLRVEFRKEGDRLIADWTGSAPQVKGALNCTLSFTEAAVYAAVMSVLPGDIPNNEGFFRCIEVIAPPGTIANCVLPASTAARALTGFRQVDCCFGALAKMLPDQVFACSDGGCVGVTVGCYTRDRQPVIYVDFGSSAWGGRPWADGLQGNSSLFANNSSASVEMVEAENPIRLLCYEFVQDAMGAGKFRGGAPYRRDYRFLEGEGVLQIRNDRCSFRPFGLHGGKPGKPGRNVFNPETAHEVMTSKVTRAIHRSDVFRYETPGGGGWGDPLERDPERVLMDVRNEYLSQEDARREYGVIVDVTSWRVDTDATVRVRNKLRSVRCWSTPPFIDRGRLPDGVVASD